MSEPAALPQRNRGRLPGLDLAKGLAAIGVVAIHAAPRAGVGGAAGEFYLEYGIDGIARLAVPIFLIVSGVLAGYRAVPAGRFRSDFASFLRLHLVWSGVYWAIAEVMGQGPDVRTLKWLLLRFGEGAYPGQYYFVVMLQIYALLALGEIALRRVVGAQGRVAESRFWETQSFMLGSAALASCGLAFLGGVGAFGWAEQLPRLLWRVVGNPNVLWLWLVFFALGAWLGARMRGPESVVGRARATLLALAGVALGLLAWPEFPNFSLNGIPYPYAKLGLYGAAGCVAFALAHFAGRAGPGWLRAVGERSFGVFVLNPALLIAFEVVFGASGGVADSLLRTAAAVTAACLFTRPLERLLPWAMR